jgi:hypothetical protein
MSRNIEGSRRHHGWLPGQLSGILENVGFSDIRLATRVVVFSPELAASYFARCVVLLQPMV